MKFNCDNQKLEIDLEIITFIYALVGCGDIVWCFKYSSANNKIDIDGKF
jgi:hypothetical protein